MSSFVYNGKEVFYLLEGNGKPILILNGIMMSTKSWAPFVKAFTKHNTLLRVDFFDQGQTSKLPGETYTQDLQVDLLDALLNHLQIPSISIVGISYGGEVAIQYAIKFPSCVTRMILFNTTAYTSPWLTDIGRGWIAAGHTRNGRHYYQTTIPVIYSPHYYETKLDWMKKREEQLIPVFSNPEFLDAMERLIISAESFDVRNSLHLIQAKTLIISAEMDYLTPVDNQEFLHHQIKGSDWIKIPYAGHASMYEKPLLFTSLVLGYINVDETEYTI